MSGQSKRDALCTHLHVPERPDDHLVEVHGPGDVQGLLPAAGGHHGVAVGDQALVDHLQRKKFETFSRVTVLGNGNMRAKSY